MRTTRLQVTLREVTPPVLRIIDVPADLRLDKVHEILQVAIGWANSHLHLFVIGDRRYGSADPEAVADELDETTTRLSDVPEEFTYVYDFGDAWVHDVQQQPWAVTAPAAPTAPARAHRKTAMAQPATPTCSPQSPTPVIQTTTS